MGESRIGEAAMVALARQPDEAGSRTRTLFVSLATVYVGAALRAAES